MIADSFDLRLNRTIDNYAVMGNPVAHSKSPQIHQAFASQTSQLLDYQSILVPLGQFDRAVFAFREAGGNGLNVTVPFKEDAWKISTVLTDRARIAGAVNTLSFTEKGDIKGDNTDGAGLLRDLERNAMPVTGSRVLILGAGGAVRGILAPLLEKKPDSVVIANRTLARAEGLMQEHNYFPKLNVYQMDALSEAGSFDLIINAISSGLKGELPLLPGTLISNQTCCYDMVYGNVETVFVKWARQHAAKLAVDGLGMLVEQAAEAFYIWRGVRPVTLPVIEKLRRQGQNQG